MPRPPRPRHERAEWVRDHAPERALRYLDVGGNDGSGTALVAPRAVLAVNAEPDLGALALSPGRHPAIRPVGASADALPFRDRSFDLITCIEVLEHVAAGSERKVVEEMRRVAVPGARLILTTPHAGLFAWLDPMDARARLRRLRGIPDKGHHHFTLAELERLLAGLFAIESVHRNSLFLHPLSTALGKLDRGALAGLRAWMSDWDWAHDFGPASFNVCLLARAT